MYIRKLILLFLFVFVCNWLFAATFTVTSNADSGPGTLRQALLDATSNGTATTDYIYFNLSTGTQADITITLQSQLPDVTANVIIDGTTQPGLALGVSNAKVIITPAVPAANFNAFNVSSTVAPTDMVQFYGLYIAGFSPNQPGLGSAIVTNANCLLVVGAPGKGNVISGNDYAFNGHFINAIIQSNFIGVQPDGITAFNNSSVFYCGEDYNNLLIGGATALDGNVILGGYTSGINLGGIAGNANKNVATIENNYFNTDYTGTKSISVANNSCIVVNDPLTILFVTGNVFSASEIAVLGVNKSAMIITGNFFGTDKTQTFPLGAGTWAIENNGVNSVIGGAAATDQNIFTNYQNPIDAYNNSFTDIIENSFYCNTEVQLNDPTNGKNFIRITTFTNTSVGGDAPAGSTVQLYYTQTKCTTCNPNSWFATVTASATGTWLYTGAVAQNVLASSTLDNNTVGFQFDSLTTDEATITNLDCHHGGSIALKENRTSNFQFEWTDSKGNPVGSTQNISGLQPGTYTLQINENGTCPSVTGSFTIIDLTPHTFGQTTQLDCSNPTGTFTTYPSTGPGITVANYYWEDAQGTVISNKQTVSGLTAGNYYAYITDSNGCNSAKALCQVLPATATPVINTAGVNVTNSTCGLPNGSITGITLTNGAGTNFGWNTANGTLFSVGQLNLTNAPAGQYYFFVDYDFNCPQVASQVYTITSTNVITLTETVAVVTSSTCSNSNGSVKGIAVSGATTYQWFDSNNNLAGSSVDLVNALSGTYHLVASNTTCSQQSQSYTINNIPAVDNFPSTFVTANAICAQSDGGVTVTFDPTNAPVSYRWTAAANNVTLISNAPLVNVPTGNYNLYVTDNNGCESLYKTYTVGPNPNIQITAGSAQITSDQCGQGIGTIENIAVTGGARPYNYTWFNASKQIIGVNLNLMGLPAGVYTLQVQDASTCDMATQNYTVTNESNFVAAPAADNVQICGAGPVLISVTNPQAGFGYRLYETQTSAEPLADNTTGIFNTTVSGSQTFYLTQYTGTCESARTPVNVAISLSDLTIPNTFTPNNDGINDLWVIKGIENYPNVLVQIFNRYGQRIFESKGYASAFDGKYSGSLLPPGVYYYILNLNSNCSLLSGSLALIR
jgi:gliding motility-associated-like protein